MDYVHPIRARISGGGVALGLIVRLARNAEIARIAHLSGHDFLFLDVQHGAVGPETVAAIAEAGRGCRIATLVRVRSCDDPDTARYLDLGADGIIVPNVGSADEARRAVRAARFAPLGRRSFAGPVSSLDYARLPAPDAMRALEARTLVICMIETLEGVRNAAAIAAVEGVDALHVGGVDLQADMGLPDGFAHREVGAAFLAVIEATLAAGRIAGIGGDRDPARLAGYLRAGARLFTTGIDASLLLSAASAATEGLRRDARSAMS